jgi:hypothetical protein
MSRSLLQQYLVLAVKDPDMDGTMKETTRVDLAAKSFAHTVILFVIDFKNLR